MDGYLRAAADEVGFLADDDELSRSRCRSPEREPARVAALTAHATQVQVLPGGFALSNRIAQPLPPFEYYRWLGGDRPPRAAGGAPAADVFAGLT